MERSELAVEALRARAHALESKRPPHRVAAVVVRPGGFTVGAYSLADDLMQRAGVRNVAAEQGLDRWGSLSMEALLRSNPDLIVLTGYRGAQPSLANTVLQHPALRRLGAEHRTTTVRAALWACGSVRSLEAPEVLQKATRH
jgi:iron complex transport system substrate-binding protein